MHLLTSQEHKTPLPAAPIRRSTAPSPALAIYLFVKA